MKRVSIRDVAREAGVSITTVSRALNGYSDVSEATKARIREVAEQLDYAPNANARGLSSKAVTTIGLLVSDLSRQDENGFLHGHLSGLYRFCAECSYEFILLVTETEQQKKLSFRQLCRSKNLSGLIVTGLRTDDTYYEEIMKSDIPCGLVDMEVWGNKKCNITIDNVTAAKEAVQYLISQGHRHIAMLNGKKMTDVSGRRYAGYMSALVEADMPLVMDYMRYCDFDQNMAYEETKKLLTAYPQVTALFCASDVMALGAIQAVYELGLKVPEDVSVVGFDDIVLGKYVYNGLTTIHQDPQAMGYEGGKAVRRMILGEDVEEKIVLPHKLVIRGTSGPVPDRAREIRKHKG